MLRRDSKRKAIAMKRLTGYDENEEERRRALKKDKEPPINPAAYLICVQVLAGRIVVSQPNLGLTLIGPDLYAIQTLQEIGNLVGEMMIRVKKELAKRTVQGLHIPPPTLPKQSMDIPAYDLVGVREAARYLRISSSTILRMCHAQVIPSRRRGNRFKILRNDLDRYLKTAEPSIIY